MTRAELMTIIRLYRVGDKTLEEVRYAVEAYSSAINEGKPIVSGSLPLADVKWLHLGTTDEYSQLKKRIAHICHDVTEASCIDEICINDIVVTFRQFGYEVVKQ